MSEKPGLNPANFFGVPAGDSGEWSWQFAPPLKDSPRFVSRLDSQAWLGENRSKLRTTGLTHAQLTHRGAAVGESIEL